ncbi:NADase-type glycan-binding domain-containing protein [Treponema maltophilum]|uniref:NADase-type glycan-binding domain-containing protein n=1 Tax=Treponema maltophilum TaxID=51160 RepID=UPI003D94FCFB
MKKIITCMLTVLIYSNLFSFDWATELEKNCLRKESTQVGAVLEGVGMRYKRIGKEIRVYDVGKVFSHASPVYDPVTYEPLIDEKIITYNQLQFDTKTHYLQTKIEGVPALIVLGDEYLFVSANKPGISMTSPDGIPEWKTDKKFFERRLIDGVPVDHLPVSDVVKKVTVSSFLSETNDNHVFEYNGYNIETYIMWDMFICEVNPYCFPWVENAAGGGIGEWIELKLDSPQNAMYVLNGFVDGTRPHLYKMNSRMQTALVEGTTVSGKKISQTVRFEDFVYFRTIVFVEPVERIRITIQSVYEGDKWQDTAISAIMFPEKKRK